MIDQEQYIEHEVKLRVLKETSDDKFSSIDRRFDHLESKIDTNFHIILGIFIASVLLPIVLHALKLT